MDAKVVINAKNELVAEPDILMHGDQSLSEWYTDIIFNGCGPNYTPLAEGVYVEFVLSPNIKDPWDTLRIEKTRDYYIQPVSEDGLYIYYCIKTYDSKDIKIQLEDGFSGLYYDSDKNCLMFQNKELTDLDLLANIIPTLFNEGDGVADYCEKFVFSIYNLKKCVQSLQKQSVQNCSKLCRRPDDITKMRDMLFISIYIIESLVCQERYSEALEILKQLGSCNDLCNTKPKKSNCNCNV